jgi:RecA-family ATPase
MIDEDLRERIFRKAGEEADAKPRVPLAYVYGNELGDDLTDFDDELIEGVLGTHAMAVLYGDSNSGKTFLVIEMAARISLGQSWLGQKCMQGIVLILATEGERSVRRRLLAWTRHYGRTLPDVVVVQSPINLFDGKADIARVLAVVEEVEARTGRKTVLIVGDTLARISAGANENAGQDMGAVMANADAIRAGAKASFLWVHHCGKDAARGARGWSGMRAAVDTEIEVVADDATGARVAEVTKQRDLPGKGDRYGFRLQPVLLGRNRWGTERGACVVIGTDAPPRAARGKRESEIAGAVRVILAERGSGMSRKDLQEKLSAAPYTWGFNSVRNEVAKLIKSGALHYTAGFVAIAGAPAP